MMIISAPFNIVSDSMCSRVWQRAALVRGPHSFICRFIYTFWFALSSGGEFKFFKAPEHALNLI